MKRFSIYVLLITLVCMMFSFSTAFAESISVARQKAEIDKLHNETLERLYEKYPAARRVLRECYAYATLSNSGTKVLFVGSSHGRGIAINRQTGERVYLKMKEVSAGIGLGAKEYDLVFVLENKDAWDSFIVGKTRFGGSAEASANDGRNGGTVEGADIAARGVWVYQMTKKGLTLEASLKGTKIFKDKKLNK